MSDLDFVFTFQGMKKRKLRKKVFEPKAQAKDEKISKTCCFSTYKNTKLPM